MSLRFTGQGGTVQKNPQRVWPPVVLNPVAIRRALGYSQTQFSRMLGVGVKTLHKWEQRSRRPSGAARTLLRVAAVSPQAVKAALAPAK